MHRDPFFSIIVCTRDRGAAVAPIATAVLAQEGNLSLELVVVDNGSGSEILAEIRRVAASGAGRIQVHLEPTVGLSAARNAGVRNARGTLILFLDDDAIPSSGWLEAYLAAFAEPGVLAAGGPVEPEFTGPLPDWLVPRYQPYLSAWDLGTESVDLRYNELPRGANMAFRREAFELVGGFDRRLGRSGRSLRSCEEIELGLRLERIGARTVYVPDARVRHRVEADRLTPAWMTRRFAAQGFSEAIIDWKHWGLRGIRAGFARYRQAVAGGAIRNAPDVHAALFERSGLRGYRTGALYALLMVERWRPEALERLDGEKS